MPKAVHKGVCCPRCGNPKSRAVNMRRHMDTNQQVRECNGVKGCGHKFAVKVTILAVSVGKK